jgi:hypothetical protein
MPIISPASLSQYRTETYGLTQGKRLASEEDAVDFINQRGFILFWLVKNIEIPSLWVAVAGNRPVPDEHDDPGHVTWGWKDNLLGKKKVFYARCLRHRNAFISLDMLPYFYALSPNYGDPEIDYLDQYEQGLMTVEARFVYEALLKEGALDTISLRKYAHLSSPESDARFNRALDILQGEFKVLPVGVSEAGAWKYAFIYDLIHRHYPDLISRARGITEHEARRRLAEVYLQSVGAIPMKEVGRLFGWKPDICERVVQALVNQNVLVPRLTMENTGGEWVAHARFISGYN